MYQFTFLFRCFGDLKQQVCLFISLYLHTIKIITQIKYVYIFLNLNGVYIEIISYNYISGFHDARIFKKKIWREKNPNVFIILCFDWIRIVQYNSKLV